MFIATCRYNGELAQLVSRLACSRGFTLPLAIDMILQRTYTQLWVAYIRTAAEYPFTTWVGWGNWGKETYPVSHADSGIRTWGLTASQRPEQRNYITPPRIVQHYLIGIRFHHTYVNQLFSLQFAILLYNRVFTNHPPGVASPRGGAEWKHPESPAAFRWHRNVGLVLADPTLYQQQGFFHERFELNYLRFDFGKSFLKISVQIQ
jgi:hypothetical protein